MIVTAYNSSLSLQYVQSYTQIEIPAQEVPPEIPQDEPASTPVQPIPAEEEEKQKLRGENGVLRLLQEGHFKGNADRRLREIFHRELEILGALDSPEQDSDTETPEAVMAAPDDD